MTPNPPKQQTHPTGERREELERIKALAWPEEGKEERIAKAVAAIRSLTPWDLPVPLDAKTWKFVAESPEVYEED